LSKETDDFIDEAHRNITNDRDKLEKAIELIIEARDTVNDPLAKVALSENLTKVVDGLTKNNAQLVELAKLRAKVDFASKAKGDGFSGDETNGMFDEIAGKNHDEDGKN
jgi:hypothetical protein